MNPVIKQLYERKSTGKPERELADYVRRFCSRKWNSDFSREMSRSCDAMVRACLNETGSDAK